MRCHGKNDPRLGLRNRRRDRRPRVRGHATPDARPVRPCRCLDGRHGPWPGDQLPERPGADRQGTRPIPAAIQPSQAGWVPTSAASACAATTDRASGAASAFAATSGRASGAASAFAATSGRASGAASAFAASTDRASGAASAFAASTDRASGAASASATTTGRASGTASACATFACAGWQAPSAQAAACATCVALSRDRTDQPV